MKQYLDILKTILEQGSLKSNRTGIDTISYFAYPFRHDLSQGFPLLTTKKMDGPLWNSVVHELLWFIKGQDNIRELTQKTKIWDSWADSNGNVGPLYGVQWTRWKSNEVVAVEKRYCAKKCDVDQEYPIFSIVNQSTDLKNCLKKQFVNKRGNIFEIKNISGHDQKRGNLYQIQFKKTGYIKNNVRLDEIKNGTIKDVYEPSVCGIGYLGECNETILNPAIIKNIKKTWEHMIERCYKPLCKEYKYYGAKQIYVCKRWHCFSNFFNDVQRLPNWQNKIENLTEYNLDKDYYSSNCYSPNTCVWLLKTENITYTNCRPFISISPSGNKDMHVCCTDAIKKHGFSRSSILRYLSNKSKNKNGWQFKYLDDNYGYSYRYALPINQLAIAIEELKNNPNNRRIVVSAWNPAEIHKMSLPPCHLLCILNVLDNKLCMHVTQRSCDAELGIPFNIASYALLDHILAEEVGLEPGILSMMFVDCHLYYADKNDKMIINGRPRCDYDHTELARQQLTREPYPLCQLKIHGNHSWDNHQFEDFELIDYKSYDRIRANVAI